MLGLGLSIQAVDFRYQDKLLHGMRKEKTMKDKGFAVCMAVLWSIVMANAFHSWSSGICMGILFGMAFGLFDTDKGGKNEK